MLDVAMSSMGGSIDIDGLHQASNGGTLPFPSSPFLLSTDELRPTTALVSLSIPFGPHSFVPALFKNSSNLSPTEADLI